MNRFSLIEHIQIIEMQIGNYYYSIQYTKYRINRIQCLVSNKL